MSSCSGIGSLAITFLPAVLLHHLDQFRCSTYIVENILDITVATRVCLVDPVNDVGDDSQVSRSRCCRSIHAWLVLAPHAGYGTAETVARKCVLCVRLGQFCTSCMNGCPAGFRFRVSTGCGPIAYMPYFCIPFILQ